ncbi:uncharacterized protein LOC129309038 [Prosopis cineraria]|uniref:uncharacterized protein LOC129309038 n=1 Tax=Prosopis cineraria TaxID=364024 RepID=UPI00240F88D1|nr:uncharacterized protein LOC129309038 [Prosopis cineraria]
MSNSGGSALARTRGVDRFYNPPAVRRNQQLAQQLQRPLKSDARVGSVEKETPTNSDESTLSRPNSLGSSSPPETVNLTNLDRFMSSVTPFVHAQILSEPKQKGWETSEVDGNCYFCLGDLWESFREWSAYGVEVPLLINGNESVKQYYVPYLSGIQLYVDLHVPRKPCEVRVDGASNYSNLMNVNSERFSGITLRDKPLMASSSDETEVCNSPGLLVFEFFDWEQPHFRPPIFDKVGSLASQFPDLKKYRSSDLLPSSWFSVAWYPIYRIPVGSTLKSLDASFLTFHTLSTHPRSKREPQFCVSRGEKVHGVGASLKISLPSFALASYKLRGSILSPNGDSEWQQANSLVQAADNWLQSLRARHLDYQFFVSHSSRWR